MSSLGLYSAKLRSSFAQQLLAGSRVDILLESP